MSGISKHAILSLDKLSDSSNQKIFDARYFTKFLTSEIWFHAESGDIK